MQLRRVATKPLDAIHEDNEDEDAPSPNVTHNKKASITGYEFSGSGHAPPYVSRAKSLSRSGKGRASDGDLPEPLLIRIQTTPSHPFGAH